LRTANAAPGFVPNLIVLPPQIAVGDDHIVYDHVSVLPRRIRVARVVAKSINAHEVF